MSPSWEEEWKEEDFEDLDAVRPGTELGEVSVAVAMAGGSKSLPRVGHNRTRWESFCGWFFSNALCILSRTGCWQPRCQDETIKAVGPRV